MSVVRALGVVRPPGVAPALETDRRVINDALTRVVGAALQAIAATVPPDVTVAATGIAGEDETASARVADR